MRFGRFLLENYIWVFNFSLYNSTYILLKPRYNPVTLIKQTNTITTYGSTKYPSRAQGVVADGLHWCTIARLSAFNRPYRWDHPIWTYLTACPTSTYLYFSLWIYTLLSNTQCDLFFQYYTKYVCTTWQRHATGQTQNFVWQ